MATASTPAPAGQGKPAPIWSAREFGARGDGKADDSIAVQKAYDALLAAGGGTLQLPRGTYRMALGMSDRRVAIQGEGRGVTIIEPPAAGGAVFRALYAHAGWDTARIADLTIRGVGDHQGTGIAFGHDNYARHAEYTGATTIERVAFENLERCISRPYGSIGLYIDSCSFKSADFHIWSRSNDRPGMDPMHAGTLIVTRSHFTGFRRAMLYVDSGNTPSGQIVFNENVFEGAPGFVIYLRSFNGSGGVPGLAFRNNWNEETATGQSLVVEGEKHQRARFLHARDCASQILFEDTPLGTVDLLRSMVQTRGCSLDSLTEASIDARSQLHHSEARQFSGLAPGLCTSIAGPTHATGLRTPWFRMPLPRGTTAAFRSNVLQRLGGHEPMAFTGSAQIMSAGVGEASPLPGSQASQRIEIRPGAQLWAAPLFDVGAGKWIVVFYIYRLIGGAPVALMINGKSGLSGQAPLASREWEMLVNISENPGGAVSGEGLMHTAERGGSVLEIGGIAVLAFDRRDQAVAFANSGLFPA